MITQSFKTYRHIITDKENKTKQKIILVFQHLVHFINGSDYIIEKNHVDQLRRNNINDPVLICQHIVINFTKQNIAYCRILDHILNADDIVRNGTDEEFICSRVFGYDTYIKKEADNSMISKIDSVMEK